MNSPLADPYVRLCFEHHRDHAPPNLLARLLPVKTKSRPEPSAKVVFLPVKISAHFSSDGKRLGRAQARYPSMALILRCVSQFYNVSELHIQSNRRTAKVIRPRQMFMYLAYELTPNSFPKIGRFIGGRDHTTAMHAVRKLEALIAEGGRILDEIELIKLKILDAMEEAA